MASSVPWFAVLEELGHIEEVDPALLLELVKKIPDISDELGKSAREVVSLRVLENLYNHAIQHKNNDMPPPCSQIGFDPSDCCEDVLHHILQEASATNMKLGGPEILKWDILSFITHKKSCLPSSSLQKLKDGILEGSSPLLAALKDRSGLTATNESQSRIPIDGVEPKAKSDLLVPENEDELLQEISLYRNLLPAKRDRSATFAENCVGQPHETKITCDEASKKLKVDLTCIDKNVDGISGPVQQHGLLADSSARVVEHVHEQVREFEKEPEIQHMEESGSGEDDASTRLAPNNDACHIEMVHCEQQVPHSDSKVPGDVQDNSVDEDKYGSFGQPTLDGTAQDVAEDSYVDEANNNLGVNFQQNAADGGENNDSDNNHCNHPAISSDSDEYHDERVDIASKKNVFLSSQCTYSQELATQINLCVKCNKNGHLLVCSTYTCPLVVHESCLGANANFDENGNFLCPFCAYSHAISVYLEAKNKSSLARKDLTSFIGLGVEQQFRNPFIRSHGSMHENNPPGGEEVGVDMNLKSHHLPKTPCQSAGREGKEQPERTGHESGGDISHWRKADTIQGSERPDQISSKQPEPARRRERKRSGPDAGGSSEEENEKATSSKYSISYRKKEKNTVPVSPVMKRKKLPWTKEEEEKLKEGVRRCKSDYEMKIPWKKIIKFGSDVFQKGRTAGDLKDKWKSIRKRSSSSK